LAGGSGISGTLHTSTKYRATHGTTVTTAFTASRTQVWNSLPTDLIQPELSYSRVRQSLQTFLVRQWVVRKLSKNTTHGKNTIIIKSEKRQKTAPENIHPAQ